VQRSVARDAYDAVNLLDLMPGLVDNTEFRLAFVSTLAGGRHDPRDLARRNLVPDVSAVRQQLLPMLRQGGEGPALNAEDLHARLSNGLEGVMERLLRWSDDERRFLDRLHDEGVVEAELLHSDPEMQARICSQPMLLWKALNVREHRGRA
jgi:hypothetical protein